MYLIPTPSNYKGMILIETCNDERKIVNVKFSPRKGKQFGSLFS
jgi:hypothetical protein